MHGIGPTHPGDYSNTAALNFPGGLYSRFPQQSDNAQCIHETARRFRPTGVRPPGMQAEKVYLRDHAGEP